ncbi:cache domain-containing protein [Malonomonas rubra]|uniref:cache domain-containing protein n=1 Tax=Malonomonas rubra TaxID=57040 RepID=UPI0026F01A5B|nr:cache domain-containing protein [Malonomonas rubra]
MKKLLALIFASFILLTISVNSFANEHKATVADCIAMSKKAAEAILKDKDAALAEISKKDGKFVWKDSYVFVMDLTGKMLAHPMNPGLMKMKSLLSTPDKNVDEPKMLFVDLVVTAGTKGEGWVEYMWPKPGETEPSIKETYVYRIPGTSLFTAAGIYR